MQILPNAGIMKQGAAIGGLYGAGNAKELSDVPVDTLLSAGAGAIGGKVIQGAGNVVANKLSSLRNNVNPEITQQELNGAITRLTTKTGGFRLLGEYPNRIFNPGEYPNQAVMDRVINTGNNRSKTGYDQLASLARNTGVDIQTPFTTAKLQIVNDLDNTALADLNKNALNRSALNKIENGMSVTPEEAANLHQHLTRISGVDGETGNALKAAQLALGDDITASGVPGLEGALKNASQGYAKNMSMQSLDKMIKKHIVETAEGPVINYKTLSTGLKNWSLSKDGANAVRYTPGLRENIKKLQAVIAEHPEMKNLITPPKELNKLEKLFGNSAGSFIAKNIGAGIGGVIGGPVGAIAGEGLQLSLRGAKSLSETAIEQVMKSKLAQNAYRKSLKTKLGD